MIKHVKSIGLRPARVKNGPGPFINGGSAMQETPNGIAWDADPVEPTGPTGSQSGWPGDVETFNWPGGNRSGE